jgi:hypothetical protein
MQNQENYSGFSNPITLSSAAFVLLRKYRPVAFKICKLAFAASVSSFSLLGVFSTPALVLTSIAGGLIII